ncbi:hypothetical protein M2390_000828 [Mycetocola sp. BIGb0189]|uniref:Ig-like domain-containing protein n=1 Tax=Mycetocola sp. BIGb0189 TaxID=2940604 RepID=UPI002168CF58|nr:Ig-like domain-containing protein [Mycetocola sp. BIGb0189]MCS4275667.1 hypothetical protein [Mycetocola sp. BIGb0189]
MSVRKTMTAAALCTVALGSLIAQPAFAETLVDPSTKATTNNQTAAADIAVTAFSGYRGTDVEGTVSFPNGTVAGQIKYTAPAGTIITKVDTTDAVISADRKTAILGKNTDTWTLSRRVSLQATPGTTAPAALTGGKVEVIKDGSITKSVDFGFTLNTAFASASVPSFVQGLTGVSTIKFTKNLFGQLKFTAPTGTRIKAINYSNCTISPDGLTALCGVNTDTWGADRTVTLESDGTHTGTFTDGKVEAIYDGQVRDSIALKATVTSNLVPTDAVINAGESGTATVKFTKNLDGTLQFVAPAGTTFTAINSPYCVISADGTTADCGHQPNWGADKILTFTINAGVAPGTVYSGGIAKVLDASGKTIASTEYKITVGNKVAKPTVTVNHNVLSGTGIPGATINVRNDANQIVGSAIVGTNGTWSIAVPFQGNGHRTVNVSQAYGTGTSDTQLATIDFGQGVQVTTPANNGTVTTEKTTFTGTGTVGATIEVKGTSKSICTTTVKTDGTWTCDSTIALANGKYTFQVVQTSGTIPSTVSISFTRAYSAAATPVKLISPAQNTAVYTPRPLFQGTGQPGAAIRVFGTSRTVATTTVRADGTWEAPATIDLSGKLALTVEQTPTNGAAPTREVANFGIRTGTATAPSATTPAQNSTIATKRVTYTGKGEPGADITISGTTRPVAHATVDINGNWTTTGTFDLADGTYRLSITQKDANTGEVKTGALTFTIRTN